MGLARLAEDVRGDDLALVLADVGEQPNPGDVADGPQPLPGAQLRVDPDAMLVERGADRLQAKPGYPRTPARGRQQPVPAQFPVVLEDQDVVGTVTPRGDHVYAEHQFDAVAAQLLTESFAERRWLVGQQVPGGFGDGHLAA